MPKKSFVWNKTDQEFKDIVKDSIFYSEVAKKLGYNCVTNYRTIKKRIKTLNLDTSHFKNGSYVCNLKKKKKTLKEICVKEGTYNTGHLKRRLFDELKWEHKCSFCKKTEWKSIMTNNMEKIPLELDHINGNNKDHRLENLRLLCPNCHATTSTFKGRNVYKENNVE